MSKLNEIKEGLVNHFIPPKDLRELIDATYKSRKEICDGCPHQSSNAKKEGYSTIRLDLHCTKCGCPLETKLKSLSTKCPINKWQPVITEENKDENVTD